MVFHPRNNWEFLSIKGALEVFSRTTALEWGECGIQSNCLVAGFMETGMSAPLSTAQKDRIFKRTSLKKPMELAAVADMVMQLFSDKSCSVTDSNVLLIRERYRRSINSPDSRWPSRFREKCGMKHAGFFVWLILRRTFLDSVQQRMREDPGYAGRFV